MLRGINVSGHRKVGMSELRALYEAIGYRDVTTYIQSGNVVFTATDDVGDVRTQLERGIAGEFGHDVTVVLRTGGQLGAIIKRNPFLERGCDPGKLHVTFMADAYDPARLTTAKDPAHVPDEFEVVAGEVYLHCPQGYGTTKLHNAFWERRLGVRATTRNWNTVNRLCSLAQG